MMQALRGIAVLVPGKNHVIGLPIKNEGVAIVNAPTATVRGDRNLFHKTDAFGVVRSERHSDVACGETSRSGKNAAMRLVILQAQLDVRAESSAVFPGR